MPFLGPRVNVWLCTICNSCIWAFFWSFSDHFLIIFWSFSDHFLVFHVFNLWYCFRATMDLLGTLPDDIEKGGRSLSGPRGVYFWKFPLFGLGVKWFLIKWSLKVKFFFILFTQNEGNDFLWKYSPLSWPKVGIAWALKE